MWSWWQRPVGAVPDVVLYTRRGCHLCDDALAILQRVRSRQPFTLRVEDVDGDPQLVAQFDQCVPVVVVNGKVRFRGRVSEPLLRRLLTAESQRNNSATDTEKPGNSGPPGSC